MSVKIYVNDSKGDESIEKMVTQLIQLGNMVETLQDNVDTLTKVVERLKTQINPSPTESRNMMTKAIESLGNETSQDTLEHYNPNIFEPSKFNRKYWNHLELTGDKIKYRDKKNSNCTLPLSVHELEIIREANEKTIYKKDYHDLVDLLPVSNNTVAKAIYNIRTNPAFDKLLNNLHEQIMNCKFNITDEGYIQIGKTITPINKNLANEWIFQCQNKQHLQKLIYKIQKTNPKIEKMQIKIICENYNNDKLLNLISTKKHIYKENNPSKRRDLLQNAWGEME